MKQSMWRSSVAALSIFCGALTSISPESVSSDESRAFVTSFIDHYSFDIPGRYTREYHPFLLEKTTRGFGELEDRLKTEGLHLDGRVIIAGYEGAAMPSYYTDFSTSKINDEASHKTTAGWSMQLHNQFGFMTGFLLKNVNSLPNDKKLFEHINPQSVELFRDRSGIFQEHAFGETYGVLNEFQEYVNSALAARDTDPHAVLRVLVHFWKGLYEQQVTARREMIAGTQDVLFSVAYANHLLSSSVPLEKYYMGSDITYPIETFIGQTRQATHVAQEFVQKFIPTMQSRHGENTVYIFCSFVDGVGKSTMLGNVCNWQKFGNDIERYERVDNSSSQYATLYDVGKQVYIADLPAQISHFTYKPDGFVYVPVETEVSESRREELRAYARANIRACMQRTGEMIARVRTTLAEEGSFAPLFTNPAEPAYTYIRNAIMLGRPALDWVPFEYEDGHYLVHHTSGDIRVLSPLGSAQSAGLKNIESEQMLWYDGVRFPIAYEAFLADLVCKLKERSITRVVFVDFLSMYPRSQRENIRLNYLLQQMAMVSSKPFSVAKTLYKDFVGPSQLLVDCHKKPLRTALFNNFVNEVVLRLALYRIYHRYADANLAGVSLQELTTILAAERDAIAESTLFSFITACAKEKFDVEMQQLERIHGRSKDYVNVQQLSLEHVALLSDTISTLMQSTIGIERLKELWDLSSETIQEHFSCHLDCKDPAYLGPCVNALRSAWYTMLAQLLESTESTTGSVAIVAERYPVPPMLAIADAENLYVVQRVFEPAKPQKNMTYPDLWNLQQATMWGTFEGKTYPLDWLARDTAKGVYAFGYQKIGKKLLYDPDVPGLDDIVHAYQEKHGAHTVIPTSNVYRKLTRNAKWQQWYEKMAREAAQNGEYPLTHEGGKFEAAKLGGIRERDRFTMKIGRMDQRAGARLFVRAIATLEMVMKDPEGSIAVRFGNHKDFAAALHLLEEVVLPAYFGIIFRESLFDEYEKIEPIIGWKSFAESY